MQPKHSGRRRRDACYVLVLRYAIDELSSADLEEVKKKCVKNMATVTSETDSMRTKPVGFY